jgi:hypothetical protein
VSGANRDFSPFGRATYSNGIAISQEGIVT